jgi:hypothetical protein
MIGLFKRLIFCPECGRLKIPNWLKYSKLVLVWAELRGARWKK